MVSQDFIFWEVDVQADFMLPGGRLYVPGAEKLLPNIRRLTDAARNGEVFLVSHGCFHIPNDPEFEIFPPHCVKGTAGAELVPEALAEKVVRVPNEAAAKLPGDLSKYQQITAGKTDAEHFREPARRRSRSAPRIPRRVRGLWRGHGILRKLCRQRPARARPARGRGSGRDRNPEPEDGQRTMAELAQLGARLTTTEQALSALRR